MALKNIIFVIGIVGFDHPMTKVSLEPFPMTLSKHHLNLRIMEIWKDIKGYEGYYQVSSLGRVKSLSRMRHGVKGAYMSKEMPRKLTISRRGYVQVTLHRDGFRKTFRAHRLVAINFIPNPENKPYINHIDGNKSNNNVKNIEWCTASENVIHGFNTGLCKIINGEDHHSSKLTEKEVLAIRSVNYKLITQRRIAKIYNISWQNLNSILTKRRWRHLL